MSDLLPALTNSLNIALKNHPEYQDWMLFEEVEMREHIYVPRFVSTKKAGVDFPESEAHRIYLAVASSVIPQPN